MALESTWSINDIAKIKRLSIPLAKDQPHAATSILSPPSSPSNRYADNALAAELGRLLFFDVRLSGSGTIACASCHQPERGFSDNRSAAKGLHLTTRNTPTLIGSAMDKWWFWDGRSDSLWSQALLPFEAQDEMAGSRVSILATIWDDREYKSRYEALFGPLPEEKLFRELNKHANPNGPLASRTAWYQIPEASRKAITSFYVNLGKSIEAFERTLLHRSTRFDRFAQQLISQSQAQTTINRRTFTTLESELLDQEEIDGLRLFLNDKKTHCRNCHNGPRFSNSEFYDVGTGNFLGAGLDLGRSFGLPAARLSEFNCLGIYSDVPEEKKHHQCQLSKVHADNESPFMLGAFKTPSLRELSLTAPYFHDGRVESLEGVIEHYRSMDSMIKQQRAQLNRSAAKLKKESDLPPFEISDQEANSLVAFLETLTADGQ